MRHRQVVIAVLASAYGAFVGWALTSDYYKSKLKDSKATNSELRRLLLVESQQSFELRNALVKTQTGAEHIEENLRGDEPEQADVMDENEEVDEEKTEELRVELQEKINQYISPEINASLNHASPGLVKISRDTPPFVISKAKYAYDEEEGDEYDKLTVTYYPKERIILDDDDEVMDDIANIIGWKNLSSFGGESDDPDVVFVRNRRLRTDFEVVKDEDSPLPLHVKYGMGREEFEVNKAAGLLRLRDEDS